MTFYKRGADHPHNYFRINKEDWSNKPRQAISPQPGGVCTSRPFMNRHTHADTHETVGNNSDTMNTNHISVTKIKYAWIVPDLKFKKSLMFKELPIPKKFQSEKISPVCRAPASLRADWRGTNHCFMNNTRANPSGVPTCDWHWRCQWPCSMTNKLNKPRRRNKKPASAKASAVLSLLPLRSGYAA